MSASVRVDREKVKRRAIQVIKSRLEDIEVGDVVNRNPDAEQGWFAVDAISLLFNGHVQLADETEQLTVSGGHKDMVGVQLVEEVVLDDRGVVALVAPPMMMAAAAPAAVAPDQSGPDQSGPDQSDPAPPETPPASAEATPVPDALAAAGPVDLAAEAAAAASIATNMDAPTAGIPQGVNLALVASLLENLDVGEAPTINTMLEGESTMGDYVPPLPANAVAVDGGALPEKPSYKNPVVVPEGILLPRRSRAA